MCTNLNLETKYYTTTRRHAIERSSKYISNII